jgi:hypothetical protein
VTVTPASTSTFTLSAAASRFRARREGAVAAIMCDGGAMKTMVIAALALLVACGSNPETGDGGADGKPADGGTCRANTPLGASVSWTEDGAPKCAVTVVAQRSTEGANELLQLQGVTLDGASVAFAVVAYGTALEGTHTCSVAGAPDGGLLGTPGTVYVDFVHTGTKQSCSVTITSGGAVGGAHATGTFQASFTGNGGAVVSAGAFDTPVKAPPTR